MSRVKLDSRQDNSEKIKKYMRDSENTMLFSPNDHPANKFNQWSKVILMESLLNWEYKERYSNVYQSRLSAYLEIGTLPICFNQCVQSVDS